MTVLVIDDEDDIRLIVQMALRASGITVMTASGGRDGLALARASVPDLIVLDVMMPEMDGYATLDALRAEPATAKVPVLMLTAKNLAPAEDALRVRGVVGFIAKPFAPRDLVKRIKAALGDSPTGCQMP